MSKDLFENKIQIEDEISFVHNWNNKLSCEAFSTFRPDSNKYQIGKIYTITLKGKKLFKAQCIDLRTLTLDKVNEFTARIDTGYSLPEFITLMKRFYGSKGDVYQMKFVLLCLAKIKDKEK